MMGLMATGTALGQLGQAAEGARLVEECIALQESAGAHSDRGMMLYLLAQLRGASGRLEDAERAAGGTCWTCGVLLFVGTANTQTRSAT